MCCAPILHSKWRKHCDYSLFLFNSIECEYCTKSAYCICRAKLFLHIQLRSYCCRCVLTICTASIIVSWNTRIKLSRGKVCADSRMTENRNRIGIILLNNACISHVQQANQHCQMKWAYNTIPCVNLTASREDISDIISCDALFSLYFQSHFNCQLCKYLWNHCVTTVSSYINFKNSIISFSIQCLRISNADSKLI